MTDFPTQRLQFYTTITMNTTTTSTVDIYDYEKQMKEIFSPYRSGPAFRPIRR